MDEKWDLKEDEINDNLKQVIIQAPPLVIAKLFEKMTFDAAIVVKSMLRN